MRGDIENGSATRGNALVNSPMCMPVNYSSYLETVDGLRKAG
jgi:hypothetical protein